MTKKKTFALLTLSTLLGGGLATTLVVTQNNTNNVALTENKLLAEVTNQTSGWTSVKKNHIDGNFKYDIWKTTVDGTEVYGGSLVGFSEEFEKQFNTENNDVELIIPETLSIDEYPNTKVLWIGMKAFTTKKITITKLELPSTLLSIGESAFSVINGINCDVIIKSSKCIIEKYAFIRMTNGINGNLEFHGEEIRLAAFRDANIKGTLTLSNNLKKIGSEAFKNNNFTGNLELPDSLVEIAYESSTPSGSFYHAGFDGYLKLSKGLTTIPNGCFDGCNFKGNVQIPEGITTIGDLAFSNNNNLKGPIVIPKTVTSIGKKAFNSPENNNITEVRLYQEAIFTKIEDDESNASFNYAAKPKITFITNSSQEWEGVELDTWDHPFKPVDNTTENSNNSSSAAAWILGTLGIIGAIGIAVLAGLIIKSKMKKN